jgi:hypothetical protein
MIRRGSAVLALVASATLVAGVAFAPTGTPLARAVAGAMTADGNEDPAGRWDAWLLAGYERAPALVLGLGAILAILPLAFAGRLVHRGHYEFGDPGPTEVTSAAEPPQAPTRVLKRANQPREVQTLRADDAARPVEAWLVLDGAGGRRYDLARGVVRLGREVDNDVRLPLATVHRYHAIVHRTSEAEYVITDLSSPDGNGLLVNGRRLGEARLEDGDRVQLGEAMLTFTTRPA